MRKLFLLLLLIPSIAYGQVYLTGPVAPKNAAFTCMVDDDMVCDQFEMVGHFLVSDGTSFISTAQDAGTDLTADLEEETHASEHLADAADEIFGEALGTACTVGQGWTSDGDGTVSCAAVGGAEVNNLETVMTDVDEGEIVIGQYGDDVGGYCTVGGDVTMDTSCSVTIGANKILETMLKAVDEPADEECFTYEATTGDFEWQTCGGGTDDQTLAEVLGEGADANDLDIASMAKLEGVDVNTYIDIDTSDTITTKGNIVPSGDDADDLGTADLQFKNGYFDGTLEADVLSEGGVAVPNVLDNLSVFAPTTSTQLRDGVLSDETGTGSAMFANAPTFEGDVNFAEFKAIAMSCDNGATAPTTPDTGQWFLHTPVGRNILMMFDGSNWNNIMSLGAMVVYVDASQGTDPPINGTDDMSNGFGVDGDAFDTIQYAIDTIPSALGGNVTININEDTYTENVTVKGKVTGEYTITLNGTLVSQENRTWSANGSAGTGQTQGYGTDTGNFNGDSYANMLLLEGGDGDYRVIDSHDDDDLTVVGAFTSEPQLGETWEVFDWGTTVSGTFTVNAQKNLYLYDIYVAGISRFGNYSSVVCYRFKSNIVTITEDYSKIIYYTSYITSSVVACFYVINNSVASLYRTKGTASANGIKGVQADTLVGMFISDGCVFEATGGASTSYGIYAAKNCAINLSSAAAAGYHEIRDFKYGIYTNTGSILTYTNPASYIDFTGSITADREEITTKSGHYSDGG